MPRLSSLLLRSFLRKLHWPCASAFWSTISCDTCDRIPIPKGGISMPLSAGLYSETCDLEPISILQVDSETVRNNHLDMGWGYFFKAFAFVALAVAVAIVPLFVPLSAPLVIAFEAVAFACCYAAVTSAQKDAYATRSSSMRQTSQHFVSAGNVPCRCFSVCAWADLHCVPMCSSGGFRPLR